MAQFLIFRRLPVYDFQQLIHLTPILLKLSFKRVKGAFMRLQNRGNQEPYYIEFMKENERSKLHQSSIIPAVRAFVANISLRRHDALQKQSQFPRIDALFFRRTSRHTETPFFKPLAPKRITITIPIQWDLNSFVSIRPPCFAQTWQINPPWRNTDWLVAYLCLYSKRQAVITIFESTRHI